MTQALKTLRTGLIFGCAVALLGAMPAAADMAKTVNPAVNMFESAQATMAQGFTPLGRLTTTLIKL